MIFIIKLKLLYNFIVRFKNSMESRPIREEDNPKNYDRYYNWYFIGSSGDMRTFGDHKGVARKVSKEFHQGLGGTAYDLFIL